MLQPRNVAVNDEMPGDEGCEHRVRGGPVMPLLGVPGIVGSQHDSHPGDRDGRERTDQAAGGEQVGQGHFYACKDDHPG